MAVKQTAEWKVNSPPVHVRVGEGVSEDVVRIVSENATALKFDHASFEKD